MTAMTLSRPNLLFALFAILSEGWAASLPTTLTASLASSTRLAARPSPSPSLRRPLLSASCLQLTALAAFGPAAEAPGATEGDSGTVQRILDAVDKVRMEDPSSSSTEPRDSAEDVSSLFRKLERTRRDGDVSSGDGENLFEPLLGLYEVTYVQTAKKGENPVGGKWTRKGGVAQKLLSTRRAFQHLLPTNTTGLGRTSVPSALQGEVSPSEVTGSKEAIEGREELVETANVSRRPVVAEAVNVISLDALFGLIRLTVLLRGDAVALTPNERRRCEERQAQRTAKTKEEEKESGELATLTPLTARTVRAYFDAPRIVFGKRGRIVNLNLGPTSSVVLDTPYCDDRIRVGRGGISGTRFLFKRCNSEDTDANEWEALLARPPLRKWKALWTLGTVAVLGFRVTMQAGGLLGRFGGLLASMGAGLAGATVLLSAGGIERDVYE